MTLRGDPEDLAVLDSRGMRLRGRQSHAERTVVRGLQGDVCDPEPAVEPSTTFSVDALQGACERLSAGDALHGFLARFGGDEARDCRLPLPAHATSPGFLRRHRASLLGV